MSPGATSNADRTALLELLRTRDEPARNADPTTTMSDRPADHLKLSLFFFSSDTDARAEDKHQLVLRCAEAAEAAGLHAVWVPERHFDPFGAPYPNPLLILSAIAGRTSQLRLRAGSIVLPLHDEIRVAEDIAVLQSLSGGRLGVSLASGWHPQDFVLASGSYADRKADLVDRYRTVRGLWRGERVTRTGPEGEVTVAVYPAIRAVPDFWMTSSTNIETWRSAADLGMHVLTGLLQQSIVELEQKIRAFHDALRAHGRRPRDHHVTCMMHTHVAEDRVDVAARVTPALSDYLAAHLKLFETSLGQRSGIRPESVSEQDRRTLLAQGVQRYLTTSGVFGSVADALAMTDRLWSIGVTEVGCLVDFGLPNDQVLSCVEQLGRLQRALADRVATDA